MRVSCTGLSWLLSNFKCQQSSEPGPCSQAITSKAVPGLRQGASRRCCLSPAAPALRCDFPCHPPGQQADTHAASPVLEQQCCDRDNLLSPQDLAVEPHGVRPGSQGMRSKVTSSHRAILPLRSRTPPPSPFHWGGRMVGVPKLISWMPSAPCWTREI